MQPVASWDELVADPVGHFVAHPRMILWCSSADLMGVTLSGPVERADVTELSAFFDRAGAAGIDFLCDARADADAFPLFLEERVAQRFRRSVWLRAAEAVSINDAWQVLDSWEQATTFLARADVPAESEITALSAVRAAGEGPVARLQLHLRTAGLRVSVQEAARALGMASRSLQRHLKAAGTSFREEIERARLELARRLLGETTLKLETIGHRIGFRSAAHFTVFFGKRAGMTPSAYRRQHTMEPRAEAVA